MTAVIELRNYRAIPGQRDALMQVLSARVFPLHRRLGMKVLGPFPSTQDSDTCYWLRAHPSQADYERGTTAFYEHSEWLDGMADEVLPLLAEYGGTLVSDLPGLWNQWPEVAPNDAE